MLLTSRTGASVYCRGELSGPWVLTELMEPGRDSADSETAAEKCLKSSGLLVPTEPFWSAASRALAEGWWAKRSIGGTISAASAEVASMSAAASTAELLGIHGRLMLPDGVLLSFLSPCSGSLTGAGSEGC